MDFVVKFVAANVSSCVLKTLLYGKNHFIVSHSSINCLQNGTKVALKTITMIDGKLTGQLGPVKFLAIITVG